MTILVSLLLLIFFSNASVTRSVLNKNEQEAAYKVLEAVNSEINWRVLYPDDLCESGPHGVVCDDFDVEGQVDQHITELNFGFVSDYSSNPPCNPNSSFTPHITSFKQLRKLFFYKCFTTKRISIPDDLWNLSDSIEEIVFLENPALFGSIDSRIINFVRLRRFIITGTSVSGKIPDVIGGLTNLEELTLSRNNFNGEFPLNLGMKLNNLKVLDLSHNHFESELSEEIGELKALLKLDLSFNNFKGMIPKTLAKLQGIELLDMSYNQFSNPGIPAFLSEMKSLNEMYLSGNPIGGQIPEIWENLGGILGIGLSRMQLVGNIPSSMGLSLSNLCYLALDNNMLEGHVPPELGFLNSLKELNLENNLLTGRLPFSADLSAKLGEKLKLKGNTGLCFNEAPQNGKNRTLIEGLKECGKLEVQHSVFISRVFVLEPSLTFAFLSISFLLML